MSPTITLARIWREGPDTLHHNRVEDRLECFLLAIQSANHAYIPEAKWCTWNFADVKSSEEETLAWLKVRQSAAEL
jgi:hypothetical protein